MLIKIFLLPPSIDELKKRLSKRNSESIKEINFRMSKALKEIKHFDEYDYVLVNDNLENTFQKIIKIIDVERLKLPKQLYLSDFVKQALHQTKENGSYLWIHQVDPPVYQRRNFDFRKRSGSLAFRLLVSLQNLNSNQIAFL